MSTTLVEQVHQLDEEAKIAFFEETLGGLRLGTVIKLVKHLEDAWDVEAAPQMSGMAPPVEEAIEEEQTEFEVVVTSLGGDGSKIAIIRAVRAETQGSLKESKTLIDRLPALIKKGMSKEAADTLKQTLETAGATVEIK
jgi:large subunit ribosomal protein L7/L12